jgi:chemotaxis protein methyltransferase CheR
VTGDAARAWLDRLRAVIAARLGMQVDDDGRVELLAEIAEERAAAAGRSPAAYVARVEAGEEPEELRALAERITVGETYFFRNANDLRAFVGAVLPEAMEARLRSGGPRQLRILSAGCSSGEEPYTLAMLVRQVPELADWDVAIRGFDVNPAAIARARAARYGSWSLRQTSDELRERFFDGGPREFRVKDEVRELVSFEEGNLVGDDPRLLPPRSHDVVLCRNVVMYFGPETTRRVVARLAATLLPGGFLFLGHAETLRGTSTAFHLRHTHDTFYYQLREGAPAEPEEREAALAATAAPPALAPCAAAEPLPEVSWMDAIHEASERIARLTGGGSPPAPAAAAEPARPRVAIAGVLDLVRQERFGEALAALGPPAADGDESEEALLLRAVVLASSGDPELAERTCARVLARDELNAEAHYVMALCREHAGDRASAADHDHYALYLDPSFAMPRLHLGLLAKRAGDLEGARRELSRALALLAGESGARLLLLGGGFGRDALVELCRAELRACGGGA